jgi:hypothetical protein
VKPARVRNSTAATVERKKIRDIFVPRPFEGLVDEPQWIALRELVPAASAPLRLVKEIAERYADRTVVLATILPMALPAMVRPGGRVMIGLQRHQQSGDVSRDLAAAVLSGLDTPVGEQVPLEPLPGEGPRLQDILEPVPLEVTLHPGFDFWLDGEPTDEPEVRASLDRANASIYPSEALAAMPAAYWCRLPDRAHVRLVLPEAEDAALNALSRVAAGPGLPLGEGTKFAGMFRAHGRLVPVWDVPTGPDAPAWEAPVTAFAGAYAAALAVDGPLSGEERRCRNGLIGRQVALR